MTVLMVVITFVIVVMRYAFDFGWIWLQETVTWMHAAVFMLAAAYTLARDQHVRVDVFYGDFSPQKKALVDALGAALFVVPVCAFLIWSSWDYVTVSWSIQESSREAGGLVFPFPSIMKTFIPIMAVTLMLQAFVILTRSIAALRTD